MIHNLLITLIVFVTGAITVCPPSNLITPCTCKDDGISCGGNSEFDLSTIFESLDKSQNQKHFKQFNLNNTFIKELKANTFRRITFEQILIHSCYNLTSIDRNTFTETNSVTDFIYISNNSKLSSPNNSIFEVLSKFKNVSEINILENNIQAIASNAFTPFYGYQNRLTKLQFSGEKFEQIGEKAFFYLKSLTSLVIFSTQISFIPANAFAFEDYSDKSLDLIIYDNKFMKNYNISEKAFSSLNRPTNLHIGDSDTEYFDIHYLEEKIFLPFFLENKLNKISAELLLDCNDCRNVWLKNYSSIQDKIDAIKCSNNKTINEHANFKNCSFMNWE